MAPPWQVAPYDIQELRSLFKEASGTPWPESCVHDEYFNSYFTALAAGSVLVEREYIDHDFLEDFAAYYVRCFKDYGRKCTRLHFFQPELTATVVEKAIDGDETALATLRDGYLGFIVVRPVPQRCVGRTCLKTYPATGGRHYTNLRNYEAHPFGLKLEVKSLAFQQQDRIVAQCATSALWSAFQATAKIFGHHLPSPAKITDAATRRIPLDSRTLPASEGLSVEQMADAIRACELEPLLVSATDGSHLRAAVHGYAGAGLPVILIGDIVPAAAPDDPESVRGSHAVTITGYHVAALKDAEPIGRLRSDRIDKVYAHDDAVGPFARMEFVSRADDTSLLTTSLAPTKSEIGSELFRPLVLLAPLYHKIRIPFERVWTEIVTLESFMKELAGSGTSDVIPNLEWDVHLTTVNDYKTKIRLERFVERRRQVLEHPMPRFIWLARADHADGTGLDLLFDATGIEGDDLCFLRVDRGSLIPKRLREAGLTQEDFEGAEATGRILLDPPA
jgi:hypothetical protein